MLSQRLIANRLSLILFLVGLLHISPSSFADPLDRIQSGDWVWSVALLEETELFYESLGAWNELTDRCANVLPANAVAQVELFLPGWFLSQGEIFMRNRSWQELLNDLNGVGSATRHQTLGREKISRMIDTAGGCTAGSVRSIAVNLARFLSGRPPAHGAALESSTLDNQKIEPTRWGHRYHKEGEYISPRAGNQMQADMEFLAEQGFKTLMCYYNVDDTSDYYQTQYHHVLTATSSTGQYVSLRVIQEMQIRLTALNNNRPIIHPAREFGPPRFECPTQLDPAYPTRELLKDRPTNVPNLAPEPTGPPEPTWDRLYKVYDYGLVPNDYNPPIPAEAATYKHVFVNFDKTEVGLLSGFRIRPYGPGVLLPREWDDYPKGSAQFEMAKEDILKPHEEGALLLECYYAAKLRNRVKVRTHWWSEDYPGGFTLDYLTSRLSDHPLLEIRPPYTYCPPTDGTKKADKPIDAGPREAPEPPTATPEPAPKESVDTNPVPPADTPVARDNRPNAETKQARRDAPAPTSEEAPRRTADAVPERSYDILSIELGMSLEDAQEALKKHTPMTSVYRLDRNMEVNWRPFGAKPFGRAVTYIRLDDETLDRANRSGRRSSTEGVQARLENLQVEYQNQLENCNPSECAKLTEDYMARMRALMNASASAGQQDRNYWRTAQPLETITLTLEKSATGEDEVLGIRRELKLPGGTQPATIKKQLSEKYGQPVRESNNSWMWGGVEKRFCQPSAMEANFQQWTHEEGLEIPSQMRLYIYTTGTNDGSWQKLPNDTRFEQCNTVMRATFRKDNLVVELTNIRVYFERFVNLFVSQNAEGEEELDLAL
jgi:hypothetical protein